MRNLKRALSLTLASVMLLGMMVVGSSAAAGYDDVSETDNVEAIEVLQAVEVMVGDERGFGPERPVNRAEMAVVMGKLLSLDYDYYATSCPFNDVYDWARGYVGACAANKIVSGRGEGIYDPGATVTAVEAASMLMRALGYFQYANDVADGFELATVRQGTKIGIFDGVGSSATQPMTRNQVAQMVLNALQSDTVEPDGNTINLTTPDGTVLTGKVNYVSVTRDEAWAHAINDTEATSVGSKNDGWIVELGERLYNGKLKLDDDFDPFGRPARKWEYDGKAIGTYAKKELLDKEYVGKVTGKDLFDELGAKTIQDYDVFCYVDGVYTDESAAVKTALGYQSDTQMGAYFNKLDMNKNNKAKVGNTGTGVKTEVYVDHDKDDVYVVVINTYLAIASRDYDEKKEEAPIRIYSIEKKTSVNEYVKVEQPTDKSVAFDLALEDFPSITSIKKDEAFLVTVAEEAVQTYKPAEVLSGVTVSAFSKNSNATVDGTKYDYTTTAAYKNSDLQAWTNTSVTNLKDRTYNIYLDAYGNLIGAEEVEAVKNYVFITGIDLNGSNRINQTADASAIFIDGTMDSIKVNMAKSTLRVGTATDPDNALLNTWCTYTKNGDIYTVKEVTEVDNGNGRPGVEYTSGGVKVVNDTKLAQYASYNAPTAKIDAKNYRLAGGAKKAGDAFYNVYGNKDSVYLTAKLGELHKSDAGKNNYGIIRDVLSVSTGIENTNIEVWDSIKAATEANKDNAQIKGEPDPAKTAYGVYTLYNDKGIIIAAVVVGEDAGTARDLVFVTSSDLDQEIDNGGSAKAANDGLWTWTRKVVRDGQEVTLTEVGDEARSIDAKNMLQYQWYQVKSNANGEVISSTHVSSALTGTSSRYVTEYQKINETVETTGIDTVLYMTNGGPKNTGFGPKNILEINEDGRTLAVTNTYGSGIHFREDVNVVLVYWQKNAKETDILEGSGIDDLRDLIDIVNEHSTSGARDAKAYYYVSALIKDGFATDIVIYDSFNDYNRPGGSTDEGSVGNVTYASGLSDSKDGKLSSDANVTVQPNGKVNADFTLTKPDWAYMKSGTADVTVYFKVFMDGNDKAYGSGYKTITSTDYKTVTFSSDLMTNASEKIFSSLKESEDHTLRMEITGVTWPAAYVKFYIGNEELPMVGQTVNNSGATTSWLPTSGDGLLINYQVNTTSVEQNIPYSIENAVGKATSGGSQAAGALTGLDTGANNFNATSLKTAGGYLAKGGDYVKVTFEPTNAVTKVFTVTAFDDNTTLEAAGTQHTKSMDLKVNGTKAQTVYAKVKANYIQANSSDLVAEGKPVKFTINVDGLTDASLTNYKISYTLTNGESVDSQTVAFKDGMTLEVNATGDVNLTIDGITAEKSTVTMAKSVVVKTDGTSKRKLVITITYDKALDRIRDFTSGDETDYVTSSVSNTTANSVVVSADKKTLVVTVTTTGADFAANDTITVDNVALDENGEKVMSCTVELTEAAPATDATAVAATVRPGKR